MQFKVITPVATEPVSLAEARLQIRLTASDSTAEDTLIAVWISAARELAEHYTGRALAPQTLEGALRCFPACNGYFDLPIPPVSSITSLKYTDANGVLQTFPTASYSLSTYSDAPRRVSLTYGNSWPTTRDIPDAIQVQFVTGYVNPPKAVKQALLLMVAWMNEHRGDEMDPDDIQPPAAKALLNTVAIRGF